MTHGTGALTADPLPTTQSRAEDLSVVICGTFRRDPDGLRRTWHALAEAGCTILSPLDISFVAEEQGFVLAAHELGRTPKEVEEGHLEAMQTAHFVWLHAPEGYVGRSAAMELGFAHALGLPVYAEELPTDVALAGLVRQVGSPGAAITSFFSDPPDAPSRPLAALQRYYERAAVARGWDDETPDECLALLGDEIAELSSAMAEPRDERGSVYSKDGTGGELADVQLYVVHLANLLGLDLGRAVAAKERINARRFSALRAA
jgi:NTP pyrophosphatase (non-canonical NTP hydrolase)